MFVLAATMETHVGHPPQNSADSIIHIYMSKKLYSGSVYPALGAGELPALTYEDSREDEAPVPSISQSAVKARLWFLERSEIEDLLHRVSIDSEMRELLLASLPDMVNSPTVFYSQQIEGSASEFGALQCQKTTMQNLLCLLFARSDTETNILLLKPACGFENWSLL